jgi:hypothetical protein
LVTSKPQVHEAARTSTGQLVGVTSMRRRRVLNRRITGHFVVKDERGTFVIGRVLIALRFRAIHDAPHELDTVRDELPLGRVELVA